MTYQLRRIGKPSTVMGSKSVMMLKKDLTRFGRHSGNDYFLDSTEHMCLISRWHAEIRRVQEEGGSRFVLHDKGMNGTFINNVRVDGSQTLELGDVVTFGHPTGSGVQKGERAPQPASEFTFLFECVDEAGVCQGSSVPLCSPGHGPLLSVPRSRLYTPTADMLAITGRLPATPNTAKNTQHTTPSDVRSPQTSFANTPQTVERRMAPTSHTDEDAMAVVSSTPQLEEWRASPVATISQAVEHAMPLASTPQAEDHANLLNLSDTDEQIKVEKVDTKDAVESLTDRLVTNKELEISTAISPETASPKQHKVGLETTPKTANHGDRPMAKKLLSVFADSAETEIIDIDPAVDCNRDHAEKLMDQSETRNAHHVSTLGIHTKPVLQDISNFSVPHTEVVGQFVVAKTAPLPPEEDDVVFLAAIRSAEDFQQEPDSFSLSQPSNEASQPSNETSRRSNETAQRSNKASQLSNQESLLSNLLLQPSNKASQPGNQVSQDSNQMSQRSNQPPQPCNQMLQVRNHLSQPSNRTSQPSGQASQPSNRTSHPSNRLLQPGHHFMQRNKINSFSHDIEQQAFEASLRTLEQWEKSRLAKAENLQPGKSGTIQDSEQGIFTHRAHHTPRNQPATSPGDQRIDSTTDSQSQPLSGSPASPQDIFVRALRPVKSADETASNVVKRENGSDDDSDVVILDTTGEDDGNMAPTHNMAATNKMAATQKMVATSNMTAAHNMAAIHNMAATHSMAPTARASVGGNADIELAGPHPAPPAPALPRVLGIVRATTAAHSPSNSSYSSASHSNAPGMSPSERSRKSVVCKRGRGGRGGSSSAAPGNQRRKVKPQQDPDVEITWVNDTAAHVIVEASNQKALPSSATLDREGNNHRRRSEVTTRGKRSKRKSLPTPRGGVARKWRSTHGSTGGEEGTNWGEEGASWGGDADYHYDNDRCQRYDCKLPIASTVSWVQCDDCDGWYHTQCVDARYEDVSGTHAEFHCGCL